MIQPGASVSEVLIGSGGSLASSKRSAADALPAGPETGHVGQSTAASAGQGVSWPRDETRFASRGDHTTSQGDRCGNMSQGFSRLQSFSVEDGFFFVISVAYYCRVESLEVYW